MRAHALGALALFACSSPTEPVPTGPEATGPLRYLGQVPVTETQEDGPDSTYTFGGQASCMRGSPYRITTRDQGAEDLVVFLQGGGACWSDFCLAVTAAPALLPRFDLIDPEIQDNPFSDWNVAYFPYCDGSLFVGDADHDDDGDGTPERLHRGLANLTGGLEAARADFPNPRRVLFAGSSGGGFGVSLAVPVVRAVFPDAELILMADSATGVARGASDPALVAQLMDEFGSEDLLPEGCEGCLDDGHLTGVIERNLELDPTLRMGVFSTWNDSVMADIFLDMSREDFGTEVEAQTSRLQTAFPDRYKRFVIGGTAHTTLLGDPSGIIGNDLNAVEVPPEALGSLADLSLGSLGTTETADGTPFLPWLVGLVEDSAAWEDLVDPRSTTP